MSSPERIPRSRRLERVVPVAIAAVMVLAPVLVGWHWAKLGWLGLALQLSYTRILPEEVRGSRFL